MSSIAVATASDATVGTAQVPATEFPAAVAAYRRGTCPLSDHALTYQRAWCETELSAWLGSVPAGEVVAVAGNHDLLFAADPDFAHALPWRYLCDERRLFTACGSTARRGSTGYGPAGRSNPPRHTAEILWRGSSGASRRALLVLSRTRRRTWFAARSTSRRRSKTRMKAPYNPAALAGRSRRVARLSAPSLEAVATRRRHRQGADRERRPPALVSATAQWARAALALGLSARG